MIRAVVSLDAASKEPVREKKVRIGDSFDVVVTFYNDGRGDLPAKFDTFISEVLYNDQGVVVQMALDKLPSAGALGDHSPTTVDAFSLNRVGARGASEMEGTLLTRPDPTVDPAGSRTRAQELWRVGSRLLPGYAMATGRAGLSDFGSPFSITPEGGFVSAVKGRASVRKDAHAVAVGQTRLTPIVTAFLGSEPVPVISEVSTIHVVP
ncbi:MAG: hypothetical protein ABL982_02050 [Vicinamibacterales bacterium]